MPFKKSFYAGVEVRAVGSAAEKLSSELNTIQVALRAADSLDVISSNGRSDRPQIQQLPLPVRSHLSRPALKTESVSGSTSRGAKNFLWAEYFKTNAQPLDGSPGRRVSGLICTMGRLLKVAGSPRGTLRTR